MTIFMAIAFAAFGAAFLAWGISLKNLLVAVFGFAFLCGACFLIYVTVKDRKLRKLYEEDPEAYEAQFDDDEDAEYLEYAEEIEKLEEFDNDSGKGYCPHCGNYGVNSEKICEACGEKVIE